MAASILVWLHAAVGLIGSDDNPANLMYGSVLAIAALGAVMARFQPRGITRALATTLAQESAALITMIAGWRHDRIGQLPAGHAHSVV